MNEHKQKILVVDDEKDLRNAIDDILTDAGYSTILAGNGSQGLAFAKSEHPDLILCDIQMPSMNGYELLNAVKKEPALSKIPFVFMTGVNVAQFDLRKGMDLGADDYLTKPFSIEDLVSAIETRLRKKQLWHKFIESTIERTQTGFILLLSNELQILVMDILDHAQSLLTVTDGSSDTIHRAATMITASGKRLSHLHENILYYSMLQLWVKDQEKIASLRQETTESYLSVLQSIVTENMRANGRSESFSITCTDASLQISPADFGKVIDELIDNACKFSEPGSNITLSSVETQKEVLLTIRDEGCGMSKQEIDTIQSLLQNEERPFRQQESGLGLTIAKTIAELYGGSLFIESVEKNGTTVIVSLPKALNN
ncbi:MAG: response regulator [Bacteroidota bacterium]|nr:response regulator [Bacteroidota bacterium]